MIDIQPGLNFGFLAFLALQAIIIGTITGVLWKLLKNSTTAAALAAGTLIGLIGTVVSLAAIAMAEEDNLARAQQRLQEGAATQLTADTDIDAIPAVPAVVGEPPATP